MLAGGTWTGTPDIRAKWLVGKDGTVLIITANVTKYKYFIGDTFIYNNNTKSYIIYN